MTIDSSLYEDTTNESHIEAFGDAVRKALERREIWGHLPTKPFAIRRFVTRPALVEGAAYGTQMVERRVLPDRRSKP